MVIGVVDCGTTNTRLSLVSENADILAFEEKKVGVKDVAASGSKKVLKEGIEELFSRAILKAERGLNDISLVVSFGMITSEIGLMEIPHVVAPVSLNSLAGNIVKIVNNTVFPLDVPVYFIPGIKNRIPRGSAGATKKNLSWVHMLDFMRGEETQIAGLIKNTEIDLPVTVVFLTSHTKYIVIERNQVITGSVTTLSGQLYEAISKESSIGKSIKPTNDFDDSDYFNPAVVDAAYEQVARFGFSRSLLMTRFLDILVGTEWYERKLFLEAVIASEDLRPLLSYRDLLSPPETDFIIIGQKRRCRLLEYLLETKKGISRSITCISQKASIEKLGIYGSLGLLKKGNIV